MPIYHPGSEGSVTKDFKKKAIILLSVIGFFIFLLLSGSLFETNDAGNFQVKQAAITGNLTARFAPGFYFQNFGSIDTYKNVATVGFGRQRGEGSADIDGIPVIFNDGSKATISGLVRVRLPMKDKEVINLKKEYAGGFEHFISAGIVPIVTNAVKLSANLRSAQDAYTTLAIFQQAVEDQLKNGPYLTKSDTVEILKSTGDKEVQKVTVIVYDEKTGEPKRLNNRFTELGCEITEAIIDVPDFDKEVENMISKRKDEAMKTELSKQSALRAKQDAITTIEQGKADIAKAEAAALVVKKQAVVEAEQQKEVAETEAKKKFEVAKFAALEAMEEAKKIRAEGIAKAAANEALVRAGLTPLQRAEIEKETKIGVAAELAKVVFPKMLIIGGGDKGGPLNPFDAVGLQSFIKINDSMNEDK